MQPITTKAGRVRCDHRTGTVQTTTRHPFVRINGSAVQVARDLEGRPISRCPNLGAAVKPCTATLAITAGRSSLVFVNGESVCLSGAVTGMTDGIPPGGVRFAVANAGQDFVRVAR